MHASHILIAAWAVAAFAGPVAAQTGKAKPAPAKPVDPEAPKLLERADDWTAATHLESGQTVCYAFTRPSNSAPALPGRGAVVLTVTERPSGRDAVAISAGFTYPAGAEVTVQVDQSALSFYTAQRSAFAREGAATVAAFLHGHEAFARSNGPKGTPIVDTFSLKGFSRAYAAVVQACPAPR